MSNTVSIESIACGILQLYPVKRAALFGSAACGCNTDNSDIDMLIEFLPGTPGIEFFGLHLDLEEAFGCRVDLVTFNALNRYAKPRFRENALRDMRVIYEREN